MTLITRCGFRGDFMETFKWDIHITNNKTLVFDESTSAVEILGVLGVGFEYPIYGVVYLTPNFVGYDSYGEGIASPMWF